MKWLKKVSKWRLIAQSFICIAIRMQTNTECRLWTLERVEWGLDFNFDTVGGDGQQEGLAGHRLGLAYEDVDDAETAILVNK